MRARGERVEEGKVGRVEEGKVGRVEEGKGGRMELKGTHERTGME
jgi:hypothetical protein